MPEFAYHELLPLKKDDTKYRLITTEGVSTFEADGKTFLKVEPSAIRALTAAAIHDISHLLRSSHLQQLANILEDDEASANDKFVALDLLKNAAIASAGILPGCQDTGTAIVKGKKGQYVITGSDDKEAVAGGVFDTFVNTNLRYSQMAPVNFWDEVNTGDNLPAEIEIEAVGGDEYNFLFMTKGGGSANKSLLFQETKALLNPASFAAWMDEKIRTLGTAACPPYHLGVVVGGTSAEYTLKMAKLASARYLDTLPTEGNTYGAGYRDLEMEAQVPEDRSRHRHRRPVRRQVLLPRRAGHPSARVTVPRARWRWRCRARPTVRPRARSPLKASSLNSSKPIRPASSPTSRTKN